MEIASIWKKRSVRSRAASFFNTVVRGPGKVILQTMPLSKVAELLMPFFGNKK